MPVLDFLTEYDPNDSESASNIGIRLNAVMLYPTSWQRREEYIVFYKIMQAQLKARTQYGQPVAKLTGDSEIDLWLSRLVDMQRDDKDRHRAQIHAGSITGRRLHYVAAIDAAGENGTFRNADKLISKPYAKNREKLKDGNGNVIPVSGGSIKAAWSDFKSVAHLWAAFNLYPALYGDESALSHPERFIPLAEWFREFGETHFHISGRTAGEPFLDQDITWRPPDSFRFDRLTDTPQVIMWTCPTDSL